MQVRTNPPKAKSVSFTLIAVASEMGLFYFQGISEYIVWMLLGAYTLLVFGTLYKGM